MLFKINNSYFYYLDHSTLINDYYQYIVEIIKSFIIKNQDLELNITLCSDYNFNNDNITLSIEINWEHTLVKQGGRSVNFGTPTGTITDVNGQNYFVRIDRYDRLNKSDIIIDYSNPNICNVQTLKILESFSKKHLYISPSFYEIYNKKENRSLTSLTTFINTLEPRRATLLEKIKSSGINHNNVNDCFEKEKLYELYKNTKILINIHQTDHHDTFEELRVLPALQSGVIVISEFSPLKEKIPYHELVIWSSYDDIISKTLEIINNYDYFYHLVFSDRNIEIITQLNDQNIIGLNNKLKYTYDLKTAQK